MLRYFHRRQSDDEVTQKEKDMKCILLLEDDENLNRGISLKLSREGYHVFSAGTILQAKSIFDSENIDLVISDITLPDGNGMGTGWSVCG